MRPVEARQAPGLPAAALRTTKSLLFMTKPARAFVAADAGAFGADALEVAAWASALLARGAIALGAELGRAVALARAADGTHTRALVDALNT